MRKVEEKAGVIPGPSSDADAATTASGPSLVIEQAEAALKAAKRRAGDTVSAHMAARRAVDEEHQPLRDAARAAVVAAEAVLADAISQASPDHEWTGKRVYRLEELRTGWGRKTGETRRIDGVVFTHRPGDDLGRGFRGEPQIGHPLVRLLLKSGKPGSKCERFSVWQISGGERVLWSLAETANTETTGDREGHGTERPRTPAKQSGMHPSNPLLKGE